MKPHQLPPRRLCLTSVVKWTNRAGHERLWTVTIGVDAEWRVREVFGDGNKAGTDMESMFDDACILISHALQNGLSAGDLADKLGREGVEEGSPNSSFIGFIVRCAADLEAQIDVEHSSAVNGIVLIQPEPVAA